MTHDEIRLSLPAFALGALDQDEHAEVTAHLATCAECAAALVEEERVVASIHRRCYITCHSHGGSHASS